MNKKLKKELEKKLEKMKKKIEKQKWSNDCWSAQFFFNFFLCVCLARKFFAKFGSFFDYFFFKHCFLWKKLLFGEKCFFGRIGGMKFFWEKKIGCRIRKFSHFLSQKTTFFPNFWTIMGLGPKARNFFLDPFPKKTLRFAPPPSPQPKS